MTCLGSHNKPGPHPEVWLQVHSPKHHFSCFSMFLRFAIREEHIFTKELRSVLTPPRVCSPLASHLHSLCHIHPLAGMSSPPGFCLTDLTRYNYHFKYI